MKDKTVSMGQGSYGLFGAIGRDCSLSIVVSGICFRVESSQLSWPAHFEIGLSGEI